MNVFIPKGRSLFYVSFRVRLPGSVNKRQVLRSCGTRNLVEARARGAEIFAEEFLKIRGRFNGAETQDSSSSSLQRPTGSKNAESLPEVSNSSKTDPPIEEIIRLYDEWMQSAFPGEKRPRPATVKNYKWRLLQLARRVGALTVAELRAAMMGLTAEKLGTTPENFVPWIRSAAGLFWKRPMAFYESRGVKFDTPFPFVPKVQEVTPFEPPSEDVINMLKIRANEELKNSDTNCYLLFTIALGAGLRVQEVAHLRWKHIRSTGVWVPSTKEHLTKSGMGRFIPLGANMLQTLEAYRHLPENWIVADERRPRLDHHPRKRSVCAIRRLAKWMREKLPREDLRNPNHWLRKLFGAVITRDHGPYVASKFLGHADIAITLKRYAGLLGGGPQANVI